MNGAESMLPVAETIIPADQAAVAEAVRNANNQGLAVYPVGGGTKFDYGAKPQRPGIGLSLGQLNRLVDYPSDDLTITVEAGMTIADLNGHLTAKRQRLPVDMLQPDRATVGGAMAINAAGPRRYAYGTMRDYVLGFTAVDGTGTVFSGGGRVVKNAAGYNMCRLMTGSLGTLGVITQVTLMVRPLPETTALLICEVPDFVVAEEMLAGIVQSATRPALIEFAAGHQHGNDLAFGPLLAGHVGRLYAGFEGSVEEVDSAVEQAREQWIALGGSAPTLVPAGRAEPMRQQLGEFAADALINVLPSAVIETMAKILDMDADSAIQAHAGDGVIRVQCSKANLPMLAALRSIATAADGKMTVLRHPEGAKMTAVEVWGTPGPEIRLMRAIKERFDPQNILNPGRFVFE